MKKNLIFSFAVASFLFGAIHLSADAVAKKEAAALANPKMTLGDVHAKAKIEEAQNKLLFESKINAQKFQQEALQDKAQQLRYSVGKEAAYQKANFKKAPKEVFEGLQKTLEAINALEHKDTASAKKHLEAATKAFDAALKANPNLKLVPIANEIEVKAFSGDVNLIQKAIKTAEKLLHDNDTQAARALLLPLEDEMVIATQFIPMDIYPIATKDAAKALEEGNVEKSLAILMTGLSTMVIDTVVIPIPLLTAQDLVIAASQLEKSKKKEASALLEAAQKELEKAVLLGYTKKHAPEYKAIMHEIKAIQKEIKGKNAVEKLYVHIKESFKKLLGKTREDIARNKAEAKINAYENKEFKKAVEKKDVFKKEAEQDTKKTVK
jgi:predicted ATP-grasp superfamily ATP-dependent carboligase